MGARRSLITALSAVLFGLVPRFHFPSGAEPAVEGNEDCLQTKQM